MSTPELESPAATAAEMNSPETRGSRATTAIGRRPDARRPSAILPLPSTTAAAWARPRDNSTVRSWFARPRTPSVPKRRGMTAPPPELALGELRSLARLLESRLLALLDASVTAEEASLLEGGAVVLSIDLVERARDAEAQRTSLAGGATAGDAGDDVVAAEQVEHLEGVVDELLVKLVREVLRKSAAVHREVAGAGGDAHAGDGLLAATDGRARNIEHGTGSLDG